MTRPTLKSLSAEVEELRAQLAALTKKLGEAGATEAAMPVEVPAAPAEQPESIAPEILLAISAAVAAYLGERAHVRQVRLVSSRSWSQQGRVSIQASHRLLY